jgi:amino acid adenylation domain-containing protein
MRPSENPDKPAEPTDARPGDIAIIGMSLRVPGANDTEQFWKNLVSGTETISHFERDEVEFPEEFDLPNYVPAKGIVEDIEFFDAAFFGILPKEAKVMDPQHRIFLELAWEAMERAGYAPETLKSRVGVYAGAYVDTYLLANLCTDRAFLDDAIRQMRVGSLQTEIGNDKDYLATRVSFKLNLRGPAMTVGSACSTSLVAIAEASRAIRDGLCDMALAGGAAITLPHKRGYFHTEQGINSSDGHCRVFDEKGSGTVFGNGAGVIVLKRLADAIRDRDHIHAVIRGIGLNNDGCTKNSYAAPSVEGQAEVIRLAQADAGVDPRTITAIEAHGTGTPLGDPIEFNGLVRAFREAGVEDTQFCALGSAKTFIGHLDVASGVCGTIKTALSLEHKQLPPLLHFQKANPKIDFENSPFYPNASLAPWQPGPDGAPRRAGVSSYGIGGTNAHLVLEEAPGIHSMPSPRGTQLFLLSARSEAALEKAGANLAACIAETPNGTDPADVAWTLAIGRQPFRHRRAFVGSSLAEMAEAAADPRKGVTSESCDETRPVHFLFPGQGSQQINMARAIHESEPRFREVVERCAEILRPTLGRDLTELLFPAPGSDLDALAEELKDTRLAQPAIFVIEYALADLWRHWGLEPTAMIGHSIGEFVAACHAGVFSLEDALAIVSARGRLMSDLPPGGMLSVRMSEEDLVARLPGTLDLAAVNAASLCVVAGPHAELDAFAEQLTADGIAAQPLHTSHAFHSRMMDPVIDEFTAILEAIPLHAPALPILSTVTGAWLDGSEATDPAYWARHLRETVRFSRALTALVDDKTGQIFIEAGPGQTLTGLAAMTLDRGAGHLVIPSCRHPKDSGSDFGQLLESLGRLWCAGVPVDWEVFYGDETRKRVPLPTYPFERKRHWVDPTPAPGSQQGLIQPPIPIPATTFTETVMSDPLSLPRSETLAAKTREILTNLSGIPAEELPGDATFLELGFDSLLLTQVSKGFQDEFKTKVKMRQLMTDFSSIDAIVAHLDATLPGERYRSAPVPVVREVVTSAPATPVNGSAMAAPVMAMAATPSFSTMPFAAPTDALQALVFQQMDLMRQQLALLSGAAVATAAAPALLSDGSDKADPARTAPATPSTAPGSAPTTSINRSLDDTLTDRQQRHLAELISSYTAKTGRSKELAARYRERFADPRTVSGFNRRWKEMIYQLVTVRSKGSRLLDVDGNEYIDILNGFGPGFLGHSPDFMTEALHKQLACGIEVGPQCLAAMEAAELFCELTGNERASFVSTGSEAVQAAIRLSRTVTGRDKVVVFARDYHGNFDEVLVRGVGPDSSPRSVPIAPGIPLRAVEDIIVLPYGTGESLEVIRSRAHELAAVLVEPVQSRRPEFQPVEFIRELREITRASGTALIFDEVITGFRSGPRGAQAHYGVEADIATYGKVVGGGMPIGVVAGKAEFMDTFDGGQWHYGDDSFPGKGVTFFAGTFVRHPLAMVAAREMLRHLKARGPELWTSLNAKADRLAGTLDRFFVEQGAPYRMPNFGSLMFVRADPEHPWANLLFFHLRKKGVFLLESFPSYLTDAHSEADVDFVINAFRESVAELQEGGFLPLPADASLRLAPRKERPGGPPRLLAADAPVETAEVKTVTVPAAKDEGKLYPLTEPLAEIWLASQVGEGAHLAFNELITLKLEGSLDASALEAALSDLVARHEALRAVFSPDGEGFRIRPGLDLSPLRADLSTLSAEELESALERHLDEERSTPFDLKNGPLFRARLLTLGGTRHHLILNAHHLVCDGWSYNVIAADLGRCYSARLRREAPALPRAPGLGEYALAAVERERLAEGGPDETWWLERFAEAVPPLTLPLDRPRPAEPDHLCGTVGEWLDPAELRELKRVGGRSGATLCALLVAAYQALLHRVARQRRFVVAIPSAAQKEGGLESLVGHAVNFLPFVAEVDPELPFTDYLRRVQSAILDATEHQSYPYGKLLHRLGAAREGGRRSLIDAVFTLERVDGHAEMPGLEVIFEEAERRHSVHPLFLKCAETAAGLELRFDFHSSLFDEGTVRHWLGALHAMLTKIVAEPGATVAEICAARSPWQDELLQRWNETATAYPRGSSVSELFEKTAASRGEAVALRHPGGETSYADLARLVDRYAAALAAAGAIPGACVGLLLERSPELVAAMLATLKAGATYLPLDPEYPVERLAGMLEDSGAALVLTRETLRSRVPRSVSILTVEVAAKAEPVEPGTLPRISATDPAYLIYTSGSTGKPKGSLVPHRAIVRLVRDTNFCEFGEDETILQAATPCFDASVYEIYGALLNGGVLHLPAPGRLSVDDVAAALREGGVTQLFLTTGLFQVMVDEALETFTGVRQVLTGGDLVSVDHMARFLEAHPACRLVHCYGPTENTTFSTCRDVTVGDLRLATVPIGGPIANSTVHILDEAGRRLAPGVPGELHTGGDGVALEYLGRPDLNAEKFLPDPFSDEAGARLYRTGDLARWRADGSIEFLGRIDQQVKIRGFRVEPGEIEANLGRHPHVGQCKVVVRGSSAAEKSLAAYVSPQNGVRPTPGELLGYLRSKLPDYLIPSSIVVLDELPLNSNGKIDTRALPDPGPIPEAAVHDVSRALTETETALGAIWKDLLRTGEIDADDDFFALGGHSLLGMKLFVRIQKTFGVVLPLAALFRAPRVRQLAALIDERIAANLLPDSGVTTPAEAAKTRPRMGGLHLSDAETMIAETTVAIQPEGDLPPLFAVHGGDGGILFYGNLAERLGNDRPFYAFEAPALTAGGPLPEETVEETAAKYLAEMRKVKPHGPYLLCGYSFGGVVAYEMACQIIASGEEVEFLGLVDTENPACEARKLSLSERVAVNWNERNECNAGPIEKLGNLSKRIGSGFAYRLYFEAEDAVARHLPEARNPGWLRQVQLRKAHERAMKAYVPREFAGKLTLFRAKVGNDKFEIGDDYAWAGLVDEFEVIGVPGNHVSIFHKDNIEGVSEAFRQSLAKAGSGVIA